MTTPPPYGSTPGQPQGYPGGSSPAGPTGGPSGGWPPPPSGGQQGYGQPQYSQPPGYPQPGYPPSAGYPGGMPGGSGRPGMVTAAAVLAFVWGGFAIIGSLGGLAAGSLVSSANSVCNNNSDPDLAAACSQVKSASGLLVFATIALAVIAILLIWGGVVALTGKNGQILVIACGVYAVVAIVQAIAGYGFGFSSILGLVVPILIAVFMLNPKSRGWFKAKGAKTF